MRLTAARVDRLIQFICTQRPPRGMTQADRDLLDAFQWRVVKRPVGRIAADGSVEASEKPAPTTTGTSELALQVLMAADDSRGAARWMEVGAAGAR
jgi:hypothetical protein